jgi:alkaline phosphatase D
MRSLLLLVFVTFCLPLSNLAAQGLKSGPMVGAANMFETTIWVQTDGAADVSVRYWPEGNEALSAVSDGVPTEKATAFVAKCIVGPVKPGLDYAYEVLINGKPVYPTYRDAYRAGPIHPTFATPPLWRFRQGGHQVFDFTIGFGSCYYANDPESKQDRQNSDPYGSGFEIFESIYEKAPDAFVWLGDTIYLREDDWSTRTGLHYRWSESRTLPHIRPMLATIPQYFTWDDHEYGPNDIGAAFWNKGMATEAFHLFTANPSYGLPELPGIFTFFNWGDANFYLLDNRTYRTEADVTGGKHIERAMHGKAQIDWLINLMKWAEGQSGSRQSYPLNFHIVCTGNQVLSPHSSDSLPNYPDEYQYLFDRLTEEQINGVIFVSGDVHFGEVSQRDFPGETEDGTPVTFTYFDVTSSSLTAGSWPGAAAERNPHRYDIFPGENDRAGQNNFVLLRFEGSSLSNRQVKIEFYDTAGTLLNQKEGAAAGVVTDASIIRAKDYR